jgi:hypothetical protein
VKASWKAERSICLSDDRGIDSKGFGKAHKCGDCGRRRTVKPSVKATVSGVDDSSESELESIGQEGEQSSAFLLILGSLTVCAGLFSDQFVTLDHDERSRGETRGISGDAPCLKCPGCDSRREYFQGGPFFTGAKVGSVVRASTVELIAKPEDRFRVE